MPDEPAVGCVWWLSGDADLRHDWRGNELHWLELKIVRLAPPVEARNIGQKEDMKKLQERVSDPRCSYTNSYISIISLPPSLHIPVPLLLFNPRSRRRMHSLEAFFQSTTCAAELISRCCVTDSRSSWKRCPSPSHSITPYVGTGTATTEPSCLHFVSLVSTTHSA